MRQSIGLRMIYIYLTLFWQKRRIHANATGKKPVRYPVNRHLRQQAAILDVSSSESRYRTI